MSPIISCLRWLCPTQKEKLDEPVKVLTYQWTVDEKIVQISCRQGETSYSVIHNGQILNKNSILNGMSFREMREECCVVVNSDQVPLFEKPVITWKVNESTALSFLVTQAGLFLQRHEWDKLGGDKLSHVTQRINRGALVPSSNCCQEVRDRITSIATMDLTRYEQIEEMKQFVELLTLVSYRPRETNSMLFSAVFEPSVQKESIVNSNVRVSAFEWAVVLIWKNSHALVQIEGVARAAMPVFLVDKNKEIVKRIYQPGEHFVITADLSGDSKSCFPSLYKEDPRIRLMDMVVDKWDRRSPIWKRSSLEVKKALDSVSRLIENKEPAPNLNIAGKRSRLARTGDHSCLTWAIELLKNMGIQLESQSTEERPNLVTLPGRYTTLRDQVDPNEDEIGGV